MERYHKLLQGFYAAAAEDHFLSLSGSCLYLCLLYLYLQQGEQQPFFVSRQEVLHLTKLSRSTYQKAIHELQERGYIHYQPSFNHFLGSLVKFYSFPEVVLRITIKKDALLFTTR